jgi:uncharacterized protein (TIGR03067 family)
MYSTLILALAIAAPGTKDSPKKESSIVGEWTGQKATFGGEDRPIPEGGVVFEFTADGKVTIREAKKNPEPADYKVDPKKDPAEIDVTPPAGEKQPTMLGIYKVEKDILTICMARGGERPKKFESPKDSPTMLIVLKRKAKD